VAVINSSLIVERFPGRNALAQFLPHGEQGLSPKGFKGRNRLLFHVEEARGFTEEGGSGIDLHAISRKA
jgi:hypothetical protein